MQIQTLQAFPYLYCWVLKTRFQIGLKSKLHTCLAGRLLMTEFEIRLWACCGLCLGLAASWITWISRDSWVAPNSWPGFVMFGPCPPGGLVLFLYTHRHTLKTIKGRTRIKYISHSQDSRDLFKVNNWNIRSYFSTPNAPSEHQEQLHENSKARGRTRGLFFVWSGYFCLPVARRGLYFCLQMTRSGRESQRDTKTSTSSTGQREKLPGN